MQASKLWFVLLVVHVHGNVTGSNATEVAGHEQKQNAVPRIVGGINAEHGQFYGIVWPIKFRYFHGLQI